MTSTRVISAALAVALLASLGWWGGATGLKVSVLFAVTVSAIEFARMISPRFKLPRSVAIVFCLSTVGCFCIGTNGRFDTGLLFSFSTVAFLSSSLWLARNRVVNSDLLFGLSLGIFGLAYCALFPLYAERLISGPDGPGWFGCLLAIVFAGDTAAYFSGRQFGRRGLMPEISPKKTWAGSVGGLGGSSLAGVLTVGLLRPDVPWTLTLPAALSCGLVAQTGDLLISLVKRVTGVKDSGKIMPGHGGLLDRLDGIFIACPLVHAFALWVG